MGVPWGVQKTSKTGVSAVEMLIFGFWNSSGWRLCRLWEALGAWEATRFAGCRFRHAGGFLELRET